MSTPNSEQYPGDPEFAASHEKLWEIIKDCRFAMLTTLEEDGSLRARPMTTVQKNFGGTLWFFAPTDSDAARAVETKDEVCVAYANIEKDEFVSVSGTASLVQHTAIKEALWNPMVQAWFPQGPSSPEVSVIKIEVDRAEFWNAKQSKLMQTFSMAKAYVQGTQPKDIGEHREIRM